MIRNAQDESRAKRTKVNGYTILILSDNSSRARENAVEAKDTFEENFPETEVKMYYETPSFYVTAGSYLTKELKTTSRKRSSKR